MANTAAIDKGIESYNPGLLETERAVAELLTSKNNRNLPDSENKIWHAHPVWFIDGNPNVEFSKL